jgi:hypothetical protein
VNLLGHAPHGFAQERSAHHRAQTVKQVGSRRCPEIAGQKIRLRSRVELTVGGEVGQIKERRIVTGIFPVDEPEAIPLIDEVGGEQVVVAQREFNRANGALQRLVDLRQAVS